MPPDSAFHSQTFSTNASRPRSRRPMLPLGGQLALDHHLGGDAGVVGARQPQRRLAAHALEADQHVLQRVVQRVADVQRAGDVRRRDDDRERLARPDRRSARRRPTPPTRRRGAVRRLWDRRSFRAWGAAYSASLPFMGRADREAIGVGRLCRRPEAAEHPTRPTLRAGTLPARGRDASARCELSIGCPSGPGPGRLELRSFRESRRDRMNVHKNARTHGATVEPRWCGVCSIKGQTPKAVATAFGVDAKTVGQVGRPVPGRGTCWPGGSLLPSANGCVGRRRPRQSGPDHRSCVVSAGRASRSPRRPAISPATVSRILRARQAQPDARTSSRLSRSCVTSTPDARRD